MVNSFQYNKTVEKENDATNNFFNPKYEKIFGKIIHPCFGAFIKVEGKDFWITKYNSGHGGSAWKIFVKNKNSLIWLSDCDENLNPIENKHKSVVGKEIPVKEFNTVPGYKGL